MSRDEGPSAVRSTVRSTRRLAVARGAGAVASGVGLAAGAVGSAAAHHSYPATYDTAQRVTVTGTVQLVRFVNPHVHVVIEEPLYHLMAPATSPDETATAPDDAATYLADPLTGEPTDEGAVDTDYTDAASVLASAAPAETQPLALSTEIPSTVWLLDGPSPAQAQRIGLTPENLPVGTSLTVVAWPSRTPGSHDLAPLTITLHNGFQIRVR